ncbi:electron transport protein SCO1/SenC [Emticicia oligotrophica DSM 17448]|uniref:Electron transport protein SCO1/SenC n=1 Tax=Emticicia oligotrophica (strain DSM 17448 / CIP 109782 / MTCC 6937 / GPTSA100-15) TaxID=929562 RepID=A0ABM5N5X5_EMTOG|nr:SCO family protein [Emticicia oligotrophica]AFK04818.1 electron transport protein SCO1/SenC [Emticicia oligotrophica DSM 17448]
MKNLFLSTIFIFSIITLFSCDNSSRKLPILGEREFINGDSVYHTIPDFSFVNQDSAVITNKNYEGKIYVTDFFFTTCPTICPVMKKQMLRVYEKYKTNPKVGILSHSIDPRHDSVQVLREFAKRLGISGNMWNFVTGEKSKIYEIGEKSYYVTAGEDSTAAGGIIHSGAFILVDTKRRVRGVYDGTKETDVTKLLKDMDVLLNEEK